MRRAVTLIAALLFSFVAAFAQTDRLGYSVSGKVVDASSGRPIESVNVTVPGSQHATVTNADGEFVIKSRTPIKTVSFSMLGYRSVRESVGDGPIKVLMVRINIPLDEASIVSGNPYTILRTALDRRRDTYCTSPELLECFYRETVRKHSRYTYVAEAVARLYKYTFDGTVMRDDAAVEKSRVLISQRKRDTLSVVMQGGPTQALTHDILKNNDIMFGDEDFRLYSFTMANPEYIGDRLQFVIEFEPGWMADYALYRGRIFIDRELLTFTRIEASLDMENEAKVIRMLLVKKPSGLRFHPREASIVINYRLVEGRSRLEYFRTTTVFDCDWKKRLFKTRYTVVNELVVTDTREPAVPIPRSERFRIKDALGDRAEEFLDPDFWIDYNIIEPSESLEHATGRLRKGR